jgi:TPP-dependent pyruvate/acetoin dehydrogenase alpha subunit
MSPETSKTLLYRMKRIRDVELEISKRYSEWKMRCPTHLSVGQEAVAAASGLALTNEDMAVSGHRAHAHYLGKGGSLNAMIAEIYGKQSGCSRGKGGSMHLVDESVGFMGSTAIVAGTIPVGVGLGLGIKLRKADQIVCIYLGDAAVEAGAFYESANFAQLKNLPVLFLCENNLYSVYSPLSVRQPPDRSIASMVSGMGLKTFTGDGNNVEDVFALTNEAVDAVRAGNGPVFMEFSTYRWLEHCGPNYDNDIGYRTEEEFIEWQKKDPVANFESKLIHNGLLDTKDIETMNSRISLEINEAFEFAENSSFPAPEAAFEHLYS